MKMKNKKKALITGGAGFVGSHLAARLMGEGWRVTVIDNLSYGRKAFLAPLLNKPGFFFVQGDLLQPAVLRRVLNASYDTVFHLAANSDIPKGARNPRWDFDQETVVTFHVLEAMRNARVKKMVFASTSAVYGETFLKPIREEYGPLCPISFYGAGKLACEGLISAFVHNFGFQAWVFRFGNVIGEHATHGAMFDFVRRLRNDPRVLPVLGDGKQAKPYLYVEDCVDGMLFGRKTCRAPLNLLNLTPSGATTVRHIAEWTIQSMGLRHSRMRFSGGDRGWRGDVPQVRLDGSKLKKLGWVPRLSSDDAVKLGIRRHLEELGWRG